jgi:hypothetical protein
MPPRAAERLALAVERAGCGLALIARQVIAPTRFGGPGGRELAAGRPQHRLEAGLA